MRFPVSSSLLAVLLAGCMAGPRPAAAPAAAPRAAAAEASACAAQGGQLRPLGRLQRVQCVVPYVDAGTTCSSKTECSGQCLASGTVTAGTRATGTCQRDASGSFGCHQRIDGGIAQPVICVD